MEAQASRKDKQMRVRKTLCRTEDADPASCSGDWRRDSGTLSGWREAVASGSCQQGCNRIKMESVFCPASP